MNISWEPGDISIMMQDTPGHAPAEGLVLAKDSDLLQYTVLFVVTKKEYTAGVGIPPCNEEDNYLYRANPVGKLMNATKMLFSPGGELFVVRGGDLFRGHMPVTDGQEWFDLAKKVGKVDWGNIKFLCFDPEGDLYAVTNNGDFYKGPAPTNENMPWLYRQATKIGAGNWNSLHALFFDPDGLLYAVRADGKLVRGSPPTCPEDDWLNTAAQVGNDNWLHFTNFIAFSPEGELWCVHNSTGRLFKWPPATMSRPDFPHCEAMPVGQGFSACCFMAFTTDKTIRCIEHFEFLPDLGKIVSVVPEVLVSQIYKNNSGEELVHSFTMSREVIESSTFSQDHGFMVAPGAKITFQDPIPFIDEAEISLNSATRTWNFTKTTEAKITFSASMNINVQPHSSMRAVVSVTKGEMEIPYRARVRTLFGYEANIEGTFNGTTFYDQNISLDDYKVSALMSNLRAGLCKLSTV
uniref:Tachylectin 2 domain-containing protein n=1 Tax=Leptobrachium leishanense TaxID=445787 RepID=A0A8C5PNJ3_9ANUR